MAIRNRYLTPGAYSEGTLRPEDLYYAFVSAANSVRMTSADRNRVRAIRAEALKAEESCAEDYLLSELVDELQTILETYAPPGFYFGSLDGDGACFGCFPAPDVPATTTDYRQADTSGLDRIAPDGTLFYVSDHGNILGVWTASYPDKGKTSWTYQSV